MRERRERTAVLSECTDCVYYSATSFFLFRIAVRISEAIFTDVQLSGGKQVHTLARLAPGLLPLLLRFLLLRRAGRRRRLPKALENGSPDT